MRVCPGLEETKTEEIKGCCLALGNFDGVHRGHQELIRLTVKKARESNVPAVVLTFDPHPELVLAPNRSPGLLTTKEQKIELIAALGVDYLYFLPFTPAVASLTPEAFVTEVLWSYFQPSLVAVGFNFTFGCQGKGRPELLAALGANMGFEVVVLPPVKIGAQIVSSTAIREALSVGDIERVRELLGYWPTLRGRVEKGEQRGRTLGFPTANVSVPPEIKLPAFGVYACRVLLPDRTWHPGIVNIGLRPTFGLYSRPTVEVFLMDFSADLYGRELIVELRHFLRPEKTFTSTSELVEQISQDIRRAREIL
ncbi:MAG: bifunctional riboflavin kinase/FAD synthetase [Moorellaceae bacterium]